MYLEFIDSIKIYLLRVSLKLTLIYSTGTRDCSYITT